MAEPDEAQDTLGADTLRGLAALLCAVALLFLLVEMGRAYKEAAQFTASLPPLAYVILIFSPLGLIWLIVGLLHRGVAADRELAWILLAIAVLTAIGFALLAMDQGSPDPDEVFAASAALTGLSACGVFGVHSITRRLRRAMVESNREDDDEDEDPAPRDEARR